jgi:hypothetical protein
MSLPGQWTEETGLTPSSIKHSQKSIQDINYSDSAVTQFCNEHLKHLDDLQNVPRLLDLLKAQETEIVTNVQFLSLLL